MPNFYRGRSWNSMSLRSSTPPTLCILVFLLAVPQQAPPTLRRYVANRLSMACVYVIEVYGPDAAALPGAVSAALDEVDRVDRLMSNYKTDSALSRINREAAQHPVAVDPEVFGLIADAMRYSRESDGAFDITVGPLMKAWGFFRGEGRLPPADELTAARRHVGSRHVTLDPANKTIAFDEAGIELDLGGIAKGYAVDRAVAVLRQRGIAAALVSSGGSTVFGLGAPPLRKAWDVEIQDPIDSRKTALHVQLNDRVVSVAGNSEKFFDLGGVRYSHIMDPRTGKPVQGVLSVAVVAATGTAADALDDAFYVLGPAATRPYLQRLPETTGAFFFVPASNNTWRLVHLGT